MKSRVLIVFFCFLTILLFHPQKVEARYGWCKDDWGVEARNKLPSEINGGESVTLNLEGLVPTETYEVYLYQWYRPDPEAKLIDGSFTGLTNKTIVLAKPLTSKASDYDINIKNSKGNWCTLHQLKIKNTAMCTVIISQGGQKDTQCLDVDGGLITVEVSDLVFDGGRTNGGVWFMVTNSSALGPHPSFTDGIPNPIPVTNGSTSPRTLKAELVGKKPFPNWKVDVLETNTSTLLCSSRVYKKIQTCSDADRKKVDSKFVDNQNFKICEQISAKNVAARSSCEACVGNDPVPKGMWTAIGCVPTNPTSIIRTFMKVGLSVAGGVALLQLLIASFLFTTSQGDPKQHTEAKEKLGSALTGLLFIIFAITILQFIGVSVFQIPGFGG